MIFALFEAVGPLEILKGSTQVKAFNERFSMIEIEIWKLLLWDPVMLQITFGDCRKQFWKL